MLSAAKDLLFVNASEISVPDCRDVASNVSTDHAFFVRTTAHTGTDV